MFNRKTPTRTEIIESHWLEYLQYVKDHWRTAPRPCERGFWKWYVTEKMEPTEDD